MSRPGASAAGSESARPLYVTLPDSIRMELVRHFHASPGREACGLVLGRRHPGQVRVDAILSARNIAPQHRSDRYEIDPVDHLRALEIAAARGLDIVGAWHTHPAGAPVPSERDRALAWEDWCYLIAGREPGRVVIRSWRIIGRAVVEDTIGP